MAKRIVCSMVFTLEAGQVSDPVETAHGYQWIQAVSRGPGPRPAREQTRAIIQQHLYNESLEAVLVEQPITPLMVYVKPASR